MFRPDAASRPLAPTVQPLLIFHHSFGWSRAFVPRVNVGTRRAEPDEETRALIRAHNRIDAALHAHYSARLEGRPAVGRLESARGRARVRARRAAGTARRAMRQRVSRTTT